MINAGTVFHRIVGLLSALALTFFLLYASRFWIWRAPWDRDGLFGLKIFAPGGDLVANWLRNLNRTIRGIKDPNWDWLREIPFTEMSVVIWGCGGLIFLSLLHWLASRLSRTK